MAVKNLLGRLPTVRVRLTVLAVLVVGVGLVAGGVMVLALVRNDLMATAQDSEQVDEGVEATAYALVVAVPVLLAITAVTSWLLVGRVLARLQEAHERQRQFVGDAAHELRSPLAAMLTRIEVGLAHPAETDWVELGRQVHRQGSRLSRLADELLVLSHADATVDDLEWVDLDELVLAEVEAVRARGRVSVELSPFSAIRIRGRPHDVHAVVRNLLDNAERHARRSVVVGLHTADGHAELVVADDGDGIAEPDRERVFERFLRLQRARDRDSGGAGLGLAIVRDVATSHGGHAWVADTAEGAELQANS